MGMRAVDVLVVDEAGQSTEAETCIAFLVCLAVVVLAMYFSHIYIPSPTVFVTFCGMFETHFVL
jgi:hypothetical protein